MLKDCFLNLSFWYHHLVDIRYSYNGTDIRHLLFAADVEENTGPVSPQTLLEGVARLAGSVKNIILAWSPEKDVKADMDRQLKVLDLREAGLNILTLITL